MPDRLWPALWTHLDVPGVEPTDNVSERAFRPGTAPRAWPAMPSPSSFRPRLIPG